MLRSLACSTLAMQAAAQIMPCSDCEEGVVMGGYDVVQYFSLSPGQAGVKGSQSYSTEFEGYTFWFHNEANLATFKQNSLKYVPAWGGF